VLLSSSSSKSRGRIAPSPAISPPSVPPSPPPSNKIGRRSFKSESSSSSSSSKSRGRMDPSPVISPPPVPPSPPPSNKIGRRSFKSESSSPPRRRIGRIADKSCIPPSVPGCWNIIMYNKRSADSISS